MKDREAGCQLQSDKASAKGKVNNQQNVPNQTTERRFSRKDGMRRDVLASLRICVCGVVFSTACSCLLSTHTHKYSCACVCVRVQSLHHTCSCQRQPTAAALHTNLCECVCACVLVHVCAGNKGQYDG
ncbi:unnamed protein product [Ceratitis capitata]|uniref:(Mediterranean fruit fly) hypothetical protein n=1 Tax=Ceratitis capitata TaxID=7213 RepID=A0A811VJ06_CERCA|nr:unnamed protein product [Ceratitis capitata]